VFGRRVDTQTLRDVGMRLRLEIYQVKLAPRFSLLLHIRHYHKHFLITFFHRDLVIVQKTMCPNIHLPLFGLLLYQMDGALVASGASTDPVSSLLVVIVFYARSEGKNLYEYSCKFSQHHIIY